jgi:formylglycine-generating enzyme required for sulfatase activity
MRLVEPDLGELPDQDFGCNSVYGNVEELVSKKAPKPLSKPVTTITYINANLYHDMLSGRSVAGILHLCNQTMVDWYSKTTRNCWTATFR